MPNPTPTLNGAFLAFKNALPAGTGTDAATLAGDLCAAFKSLLDANIRADAPKFPIIGHFVDNEMVAIANTTLDNALAQFDAWAMS